MCACTGAAASYAAASSRQCICGTDIESDQEPVLTRSHHRTQCLDPVASSSRGRGEGAPDTNEHDVRADRDDRPRNLGEERRLDRVASRTLRYDAHAR